MREWTNGQIKRNTIMGWGSPHHWIVRGMIDDFRFAATGEHPWPRHNGPDEAAYRAWKCAVDDMWQSHVTLDKHHTLIVTRATIETGLACQALMQRSAVRTIFLWLRRRRLHARLARQTSQRQLREAKWMQPPACAPKISQELEGGGSLADLTALARQLEQAVIGLLETSAKNLAERALAETRCRHDASTRAAASAEIFPFFADFPVAAKWRQPPARAPKEFTAAFASQRTKERKELVANAGRADMDRALACIRANTDRALACLRADANQALARIMSERAE